MTYVDTIMGIIRPDRNRCCLSSSAADNRLVCWTRVFNRTPSSASCTDVLFFDTCFCCEQGLHANTVAPNPIVSRPSEVSLGLGNGNVMVIQPFGGSASAWEQQDEEKSPPESGKGMVSSLSERPCKRQTRRPDADSGGSG